MAEKYNLSKGSLEVIMRGGEFPTPIMQVLGSKKITSGTGNKERFRMLLSDGKNSINFAMLTTQINDKVSSSVLETFTVIKIDKYITSIINNSGKGKTRVLLILDMTVLHEGSEVGERIGSPSPLNETSDSSKAVPASKQNPPTSNKPSASNVTVAMDTCENITSQHTVTHPISSLSPYHNKWAIKARVTNISISHTWSNSRGEGKLYSMDLTDESGEIRLTAFRDQMDKYYDYIQVDKLYLISKCQLKPANKQYSTLKNDYEMTMTSETVIQECVDADDSAIPTTKYDFVTIDTIANAEVNSLIDVIGVTKSVGELQTFHARSTGRELKKKKVLLVDQSKTGITLTLWGSDAENFDGVNNPVIVLKSVKISEFGGGKNISMISSSTLKVNPEMKECYRLRGWYDSQGSSFEANNISARSGLKNFNAPWMSFKEMQDQNLWNAERGDYYQVMGTVLLIRSEKAMRKACPTSDCNKKITDLKNGMYRCEKCNREFPNFKWHLLASMNVGDWSENQWVSMFSSEMKKVLGMTFEEVGQKLDQNPKAISAITDKAHFKQFVLKCRAEMETYNDESHLKTVVLKVDPINFEKYNAHLIERIEQLME